MDAILYVDRAGVQWRYLPHDFPHWNTVYGYFPKWADEGVFAQLDGLLIAWALGESLPETVGRELGPAMHRRSRRRREASDGDAG